MNRPENVKARRLYAAMAFLLAGSIGFVILTQLLSETHHHGVDTEVKILRDLREALIATLDLDAETQGYVLSGDEKFLESFNTAVKNMDTARATLNKWASIGELEPSPVANFEELAARQ